MLINTFLDTEDFVHLYYTEDETPQTVQGCGAGARMQSKYARPSSPVYDKLTSSSSDMCERERVHAPPLPEPPPHRVRAADLYPRVRTHYDELGVDIPFQPICGEFVQFVGRMSDHGTLAMSNYRVHVQPRRRRGSGVSVPLRMVDSVEVSDLVDLIILCKDGKTLKCTFTSSEQCLEWWRRLSTALAPASCLSETFAAAYAAWAKELPPASIHRALIRSSAENRPHWFGQELARLGFTSKGAWRVSTVNAEYKLCSSYPPLLIVPSGFDDDDLEVVARFRAMRRVPCVVWRHRGNGAILARAAQPLVGWLGWRSNEDERLLAALASAAHQDRPANMHAKQSKLLVIDARSYASAVTNRARGGGCEYPQYYLHADIQFMSLPNIHHVRKSFFQLRSLLAEPVDGPNWLGGMERSLWPQYLSGLGRACTLAARAISSSRPVLVHCSDGWDRTSQVTSTAQIMLDPFYRTIDGFRILIEREWLDFGHKFADRCGHQFGLEEANERSPIFLQWLDLVHQIMLQYPTHFQFNEAYLIKLLTHAHSCMFGTFLCNSPKERSEVKVSESTADVWKLLEGPPYRNHLYAAPNHEQVVWPEFSVRAMVPWWGLFGDSRSERDDDIDSVALTHYTPTQAGVLTKTRSCDNLLNEGEKRTTQRRCSDPNIAPEALKLNGMVPSSGSSSSIDRVVRTQVMTESLLESIHRNGDQPVLHSSHFSPSASMEREIPHNEHELRDALKAARESTRQRNISITWRSVSESSQNTDSSVEIRINNNDNNANNNHNSSEDDSTNHKMNAGDVIASPTNHNRMKAIPNVESTNGDAVDGPSTNGDATHNNVNVHLLRAELGEESCSSSSSSVCSVEVELQTLCPSPRRQKRHRNGSWSVRRGRRSCGCRCVCGCVSSCGQSNEADGLAPLVDPLQQAMHHIIVEQRMVVEQLSSQLREARLALQQRHSPQQAHNDNHTSPAQSSCSGGSAEVTSSSGGVSDGCDVGIEAKPVEWVPDEAAPRCQNCHHHFWLARRRHHCRKCGGIFCGSCSEIASVGEWARVRVCRRCRTAR